MIKCKETARILLSWGGEILQYCPSHGNRVAIVAKAIDHELKAKLLPLPSKECEALDVLSEEERENNKYFPHS